MRQAWVLLLLRCALVPSAAPPPPPCDVDTNAMAGGSTCGSRHNWLVANQGMTMDEAIARVASEFPAECGCRLPSPPAAPGSDTSPFIAAQAVGLQNGLNYHLACISDTHSTRGSLAYDLAGSFNMAAAGESYPGQVFLQSLLRTRYRCACRLPLPLCFLSTPAQLSRCVRGRQGKRA